MSDRMFLTLCMVLTLSGCASASDKTADAGSDATPEPVLIPLDPVKVDVMFVIDFGAGGCREARLLSRSIRTFVDKIQGNALLDVQAAVVEMNGCSQTDFFVTWTAQHNPPACATWRSEPCLGAEDCERAFGPGWTCNAFSADQTYNFNGSANSTCVLGCDSSKQCCDNLCGAQCIADSLCPDPLCAEESQSCPYDCRNAGESSSNCVPPPDNLDCPDSFPPVLSGEDLKYLQCAVEYEVPGSFCYLDEQGFKDAWQALDPDGPNSEQSALFLRPDAHLMIVFASNDDDCSIHEDYCAPNDDCGDENAKNKCEKFGGTCKLDPSYSYVRGEGTYLCCGRIKTDHFGRCTLLGEFKGVDHHEMAYRPDKSDCQGDEDCEDGWYCATAYGQHKCRPSIYSLSDIADFYEPTGAPIFSLASPLAYYTRFMSLKDEPSMVHVRVLAGDARVSPDDRASFISAKCLGEAGDDNDLKLAAKLDKCVAYKALAKSDDAGCAAAPNKEGCEGFFSAKRDCIRQCWVAAKGYPKGHNSSICTGAFQPYDGALRYVRLAEMFGPNGKAFGLCEPDAVPALVDDMSQTLALLATRTCLPTALAEGEAETISQIETGQDGTKTVVKTFTSGPTGIGDYLLIHPTNQCCKPDDAGNCTGSETMVVFHSALPPETMLEITVTPAEL